MGKDRQEKVKQCIKDDRPAKLKSYVKKYQISLPQIQLSRGRSLLHYTCKHGSGAVLRYLLSEGFDADCTDEKLNFPLHIALTRALHATHSSQQVFIELVLPLLNRFSAPLDVPNKKGISCRYLLDQLRSRRLHDENDGASSDTNSSVDQREDRWQQKLAEQLREECGDEKGFGSGFAETEAESYDDWADRLQKEHHLKHKHSHVAPPRRKPAPSTAGSTFKSHVLDEEELRKTRAELEKKYRETQREDQFERKRKKKCSYERNYTHLLLHGQDEVLTYSSVPWPCLGAVTDMVDVLFCDIQDRSSKTFRKYLRDQQVRWHPDKFMQKFGKILKHEDKDKILCSVKEISQELNKISESLPQAV
ncbi:NF-kappa-B inhibitor-like protein 1 [Gigantopelta aegis]|uniref:NF-kappa-B inhibitor-like protein 1 n=1 Tax=Gigantopelta aegis TaxID=1735272 RepID=UPI001B889CE1|nr:NF-kappa-B inhibitor-like protein 1 [Gigantopelta aegis]XP_041371034.1 NF-kappa-B inhibitor-like protein 1 [Gigantopelta aegis]XP_041371035.1 NF-kappa-B inhibitor-like protein 1 [Gigantopelta aegis]